MSTLSVSQILNQMGHGLIDELTGYDTTQARAKCKEAANVYKIIGMITMIVSTILIASSLCTPLYFTSVVALATFLLGRDICVIGSNAQVLADSSILRSLSLYRESALSHDEFNAKVTQGSTIASCFPQIATWLTSPLYDYYLDINT